VNPDDGVDDDVIAEDDEFGEEGESVHARHIRETILQGVEALNAYIPDPAIDPIYFKRMICKMRNAYDNDVWFPLGTDYTQFLNA
jgi:hypothetical protein